MHQANAGLHRNREFRNLWIGQALSEVGTRASGLAVPLLVLALTRSPFQAGLVGSLGMAVGVVAALPAGAFVDRCGRRRTLLACEAVCAASTAVLAIAVLTGTAQLPLIALVVIVNSAAAALFLPAQTAALRHIVPAEQLPRASARIEARSYGAELAGAPLGGFLFGIGRAVPFLADAVTYAASLLAIRGLRRRLEDPRPERPEPLLRSMRAGLRFVLDNPFLRTAGAIAALLNVAVSGAFFTQLVALQRMGLPPAAIGAAQTSLAVCGLLGALIAPSIQPRLRAPALITGASWAAAILVGVTAALSGRIVLIVPLALTIVAAPALNATIVAYQIAVTPDAMQGRVDTTISLLAQSLNPLGPLLAGGLIEWGGIRAAFAACSAILALAAVSATASRGVRSLPDLRSSVNV